jgi:uncharacterized protein (TIGR00255 family)
MEKNAAEAEYDLELNLPLVKSLIGIFEELNEQFGLDDKIAPETLYQMRDVILYKPRDVDIDEASRAPTMVEAYQKRLIEKMHKISQDMELDESRLMQEVAIFADRCDITEEIVRLRSHLKQFQNYMSVDDSIGRRLDFLIQEINREVNTISSKTFDSSISAKVVEIKGELEKLREQIQNVE